MDDTLQLSTIGPVKMTGEGVLKTMPYINTFLYINTTSLLGLFKKLFHGEHKTERRGIDNGKEISTANSYAIWPCLIAKRNKSKKPLCDKRPIEQQKNIFLKELFF